MKIRFVSRLLALAVGLFAAVALLAPVCALAQSNGEIVSMQRITGFGELVDYVCRTEDRFQPEFDASRYQALDEVELFGVSYWSDGLKVSGFVLTPRAPGIYPAVIYNRGGSMQWGSLTHHVASVQLGELARLARAGYVVAASQYRGNGGGEGYEEYMGRDLQDVASLFDLLAARSDVDPDRIGMFGWSRGGATTFRMLTRSREIKAAAVGGPAVNYPRIIEEEPEMGEYWSEFIPGYHRDPQGVMEARSVLYWVEELPRDVPLLIVHGAADPKVKTQDILSLAMKMDSYQIPYRLVIYEGGDHGLSGHRDEAFAQIIGWFDRHLKTG